MKKNVIKTLADQVARAVDSRTVIVLGLALIVLFDPTFSDYALGLLAQAIPDTFANVQDIAGDSSNLVKTLVALGIYFRVTPKAKF